MSEQVQPEAPRPERSATEPSATESSARERSATERSADHAVIDRLGAELLPALIAKLGATGLGELEVREGGWRVRLRRPADGAATGAAGSRDRRSGERERAARSGAGQTHTHPVGGLTPVGPGRDGGNGAGGREAAGAREGREGHDGREGQDGRESRVAREASASDDRMVATSPAVGIFQPRPEARAGTKVRAGDRLGSVDMLGIPQVVVAPADGLVGASLVEPGDAVEYGQELILIEFASATTAEA